VFAAAAVVALFAFLYANSWHTFPGNADDANAVLAGHAISHGNVWLHGWKLPADSYWPMDLGAYALFTAIAGIGPGAYHAVPTAIYVGVVVLATVMAAMDADGRARWVAVAVTFVIVGLPAPFLGYFVLQGPHHVGSLLLCLGVFALLRPGPIWKWCVGASLLAAALLGDPTVLAIGVAPVAVAGVVAATRARRWRAGLGHWAAAAFAVVAAAGGRKVLTHFGQQLTPRPPIFRAHFLPNARAAPRALMTLFGIGHVSRLSTLSQAVHLVGFAFALVAVALALWSAAVALFARPSEKGQTSLLKARSLDDMLALAFVGSLGLYIIIGTTPKDDSNLRYLVPALVCAAILAGRCAARVRVTLPRGATALVALSAAGLVAFYVTAAVVPLRDPVRTGPRALVAWLDVHSLRNGLAGYWDASTVTVESEGRLAMKPVIVAGTRVRPFFYYAPAKWFAPSRPTARSSFLVYQPSQPWEGVDADSASATFGPPTSMTEVGEWRVLVWDHDVVPDLGPPG